MRALLLLLLASAPAQAHSARFNLETFVQNAQSVSKFLCGSTPVAKTFWRRTEGRDYCHFVFATAGHCLPRNRKIVQILLGENQSKAIRLAMEHTALEYEPGFTEGPAQNYPLHDGALISFNTVCEYVADEQIARLAEEAEGVVKARVGEKLLVLTQDSTDQKESAVHGSVEPDPTLGKVYVQADREVVGGDSGGPIFNDRGDWVGPVSSFAQGTMDFADGHKEPRTWFTFQNTTVPWVRSKLGL